MNFVLVEGGGVETPPILRKILRLRKIALILAGIAAWYYASVVLNPENMENTRISEHSLMPGLVTAKFDKTSMIAQIFSDLSENPKNIQKTICGYFHKWDLSCHSQKFRSNVPGIQISGENVYAWIRGSRNDGGEAQLIGVKIGGGRKKSEAELRNLIIAQVMAFAYYAKDQVYWSRDILFVFIDATSNSDDSTNFAFDAFLQEYHLTHSNYSTPTTVIHAEQLKEQCGLLIAGIVYEPVKWPRKSKKDTRIMSAAMNGINGQQANLDLFNSAAKIAHQKLSAGMALFGIYQDPHSYSTQAWPYLIPLRAIYGQGFVAVEGLHSVLGKYSVPALTIGLDHTMGPENGIFIESMCRMLNNALERLHQSYFMYILGDDMHFASIAYYLPILGIISAPLLISAYAEWREIQQIRLSPFIYIAHIIGALQFTGATYAYANFGAKIFDTNLAQLFILSSIIPFGLIYNFVVLARKSAENQAEIRFTRLFLQLLTCLMLGCLGLVNFGLALFGAIFAVPLVFVMTFESTSRARSYIRTIFLFFANPIFLLTFSAINLQQYLEYPQKVGENAIFDLNLAENLIYRAIREHLLFGSAHFALFCLFAQPVWNLLFLTAISTTNNEIDDEKMKKE